MNVNVPEKMYKTTPWWQTLIEGILAMIVGFFLLTNTSGAMEALVRIVGIFWLVGGVLAIISIFVADTGIHWGWSLVSGIIGIIAGIVVLQHPWWSTVIVTSTLLLFFGVYGIVKGAIDLFRAFKGGGLNSALMGIVSIIFGVFLLANPMFLLNVFTIMFGVIGLFGGIVLIVYAVTHRN
ncbi:MAG: DUF308 domain-containing protein [Chloroflexi bacterium]|nr:DUF308 domain-containing protein [Chloroflexota bacterium]